MENRFAIMLAQLKTFFMENMDIFKFFKLFTGSVPNKLQACAAKYCDTLNVCLISETLICLSHWTWNWCLLLLPISRFVFKYLNHCESLYYNAYCIGLFSKIKAQDYLISIELTDVIYFPCNIWMYNVYIRSWRLQQAYTPLIHLQLTCSFLCRASEEETKCFMTSCSLILRQFDNILLEE